MWNLGATITGWFDWEAVGAIGTVCAFFAVFWQLGQSRRDQIDRDLATMTYLRNTFLTAASLVKTFLTWPDERRQEAASIALTELGGLAQFRREISLVPAASLPTSRAADAHHCGVMAMGQIDRALVRIAGGDMSGMDRLPRQREDLRRTVRGMHTEILVLWRRRYPLTWWCREGRPKRAAPSLRNPATGIIEETPEG